MITNTGRDLIRQYLSGSIMSYAQAIGVGCGSSSTAPENTTLKYEFSRVPIEATALVKVDSTHYAVNFRALLGPEIGGRINEVAVFSELYEPTTGMQATRIIALFEDTEEWWDGTEPLKISDRENPNELMLSLVGDTYALPKITYLDQSGNVNRLGHKYLYDFADMDVSEYSPGDTIKVLVSAKSSTSVFSSLSNKKIYAQLTMHDSSGQSVSLNLGGDGEIYPNQPKTENIGKVATLSSQESEWAFVLGSDFSVLNIGWDSTFDPTNIDKVSLEFFDESGAAAADDNLKLHSFSFHDEGELSPTNGMVARTTYPEIQGFNKRFGTTVTVEFQMPLGSI